MKKIYSVTLLPFILLLFFSCSVEDLQENLAVEGEYGYNFRESKAEWDRLKKKNGNSYVYTILEQSWTGFGSETTIEVEKGKIISRHYIAFEISEDGDKNIIDRYEESRNDLGKHNLGAPPYTMDELYKTCLSKYLIADPDAHEIFFETNKEGIMTLCGFVPHGCHDDCFRGISISYFSWQ